MQQAPPTLARDPRPRRRWVMSIVAMMVAILSTLFVQGVAHAANGGDPAATGCSNTGQSYRSAPIVDGGTQIGTVELRYSTGCKTQWVRATYRAGYSGNPSVWMQNQSGTDLYAVYRDSTSVYTNQLSNMQYQVGCGGVQMYAGSRYVGWFYAGCY